MKRAIRSSHHVGVAVVCAIVMAWTPSRASAQGCSPSAAAVQILGSGGPLINRERASTSYLVWMNGQARVLVDIGGGAFFRFGQAGATVRDLSFVALSHFHPDHVSDLPALLWLSNQTRQAPLAIAGPSGNDGVPGLPVFLDRLFDPKTGAFQVLGGTRGGAGGGVRLDPTVVDVTRPEPTKVLDTGELSITALGVPHGDIPAVAYRVTTGGAAVVFSSDQTGTNPRFVDFARGADVLIMHFQTPMEGNPLHASPATVGRIARDAGVKTLVLGHIGQFALEPALAEVRQAYTGPLTVGADLQCTRLR
jgi:ribonuclease BN (tRNA processing enzyme)